MSVRTAAFPTLLDMVLPEDSIWVRLIEALCLSLAAGLCAQISIRLPFTPVPITGQSLAVLSAGALLGARWGMISMLMYLAVGCFGMPWFAGGATGVAQFLGPTGGYLVGFVPAAWLVGRLAERGWDRSPLSAAAMTLLGSVVVFAFGLAGLARFFPADKLLFLGLYPFIPGDLFKACLSAGALPLGWKLLGRDRP